MKTYFMSWESDNKRGHAIHDFADDVTPREAIGRMIISVCHDFKDSETKLIGTVTANQFNRVI